MRGTVSAVDDETLFSALAVIRAAPLAARSDRELGPAWRIVSDWLARRLPGAQYDDVRQEALVKVVRHVDACEARGATSTASWLLRIARRTAIDADRSARTSPIDRALKSRPPDVDPIDEVLAPDAGESVSPSAVAELAAELLEALERWLADRYPSAEARIVPRVQARARLERRLFARSIREVREALDWHTPVTDEVISKWIERGQAPLDAAVRRWVEDDVEGRTELGERIRAALAERREDAGRPRPERRSRTDGAGRRLSVGQGRARPRSCGIGMAAQGRVWGGGPRGRWRAPRGAGLGAAGARRARSRGGR